MKVLLVVINIYYLSRSSGPLSTLDIPSHYTCLIIDI